MNKLKDNTMNFIIKESTSLFLKNSITNVTMSDIAKQVGIGEATLYRYFKKKQNIVIKVSANLAKEIFEYYLDFDDKLSGARQLEAFYMVFPKLFASHPDYFKFVNQLDAYLLMEADTGLREYEDRIKQFYDVYSKAYEKGRYDGTVYEIEDLSTFYYATTHSLLNLCKYLSKPAVLFQDPGAYLNPIRRIGAQFSDYLKAHGAGRDWRETAIAALRRESLEDPEKIMEAYPFQLSGGMRQRAATAMTLSLAPKLLLVDEPTSALDPELTGEILSVIRDLASSKMTMVIVTHEMSFARDTSDYVFFMDDGKIVEEGKPENVISNPTQERTKLFLSRFSK